MRAGDQFRTQKVVQVAYLREQVSNMTPHRTRAEQVWLSLHPDSHREGKKSAMCKNN
jgi:hypothetical protein